MTETVTAAAVESEQIDVSFLPVEVTPIGRANASVATIGSKGGTRLDVSTRQDERLLAWVSSYSLPASRNSDYGDDSRPFAAEDGESAHDAADSVFESLDLSVRTTAKSLAGVG